MGINCPLPSGPVAVGRERTEEAETRGGNRPVGGGGTARAGEKEKERGRAQRGGRGRVGWRSGRRGGEEA